MKKRYLFCCILMVCLVLKPLRGDCIDISLISAQRLFKISETVMILDARSKVQYKKGHIPDARSFYWENNTTADKNNIPYRTLPPDVLAKRLSTLGIDENSTIIVYGSGKKNYGGEGWCIWVLTWLGHRGRIMLLEGGMDAWKRQGFPLEKKEVKKRDMVSILKKTSYYYQLNKAIFTTLEEIRAKDVYLVDTQSFFERIKGTIPGSIHISWKKFFKGDGVSPITGIEVMALLKKNKIGDDKPVIYFCKGGIRSAWVWLVHHLSGYSQAKNFEGGMVLWEAADRF